MNEVPEYWKEFKAVVESYPKRCDSVIQVKKKEILEHYKSLPWYRKLFAMSPDGMNAEIAVIEYLYKNSPKWSKLTIEEYYNWVLETK